MKILTKGTKPTDRIYRSTCPECGTEYEFAQHEAKYHSDQRDGDVLEIKCPSCQHTEWIGVHNYVRYATY